MTKVPGETPKLIGSLSPMSCTWGYARCHPPARPTTSIPFANGRTNHERNRNEWTPQICARRDSPTWAHRCLLQRLLFGPNARVGHGEHRRRRGGARRHRARLRRGSFPPAPIRGFGSPCATLDSDSISSLLAVSGQHNDEIQLYAFDILGLDGDDLRKLPLHLRKTNLARLLARRADAIHLAPFEQGEIGPDPFRAACDMMLEGLVSKRRDSRYRSGPSRD